MSEDEISWKRYPGCVFCDLRPEESTRYTVFMIDPLNPVVAGHKLFIPATHVSSAAENPSVAALVMREAAQYVQDFNLQANIITSVGKMATQSVMHLHIHVVPRWEDDGVTLPWTEQQRVKTFRSLQRDVPVPFGLEQPHRLVVDTMPLPMR